MFYITVVHKNKRVPTYVDSWEKLELAFSAASGPIKRIEVTKIYKNGAIDIHHLSVSKVEEIEGRM